MSIQCIALPPLFFTLFCTLVTSVVAAINYPNQRFVLQKKYPDGTIRKVQTYNHPASREQVESEFGPGRYSLKAMKPRITVIWKDGRKPSRDLNETVETPLRLEPLEKRTRYLTAGLVALGIGSAVGFGATTLSILNSNQVLNRAAIAIDSLLASYPVPGFQCAICRAQLVSMFDKFCNQCGYPITSPDRRELASPSGQRCPYCSFPVGPNQRYCRECGRPVQSLNEGWRFP